MGAAPVASVLVAFHEDVDALAVVLAALADQSRGDFEVVVADDGSSAEARAGVRRLAADSPLEVVHAWQPRDGFRKTRALNLAALRARGGTLIVIDGDCVPQHHFVEDHLAHGGPGVCLSGRRACLSPRCSALLRASDRPAAFAVAHRRELLADYLRLRGRSIEKAWRLTRPWQRRWLRRRPRRLTGCNLSLGRDDLLAVNGFDTRFRAPGVGEDSDLDRRLRLAGVAIVDLQHLAILLHLDHPRLAKDEANRALGRRLAAEGRAVTDHGLAELARELEREPPRPGAATGG